MEYPFRKPNGDLSFITVLLWPSNSKTLRKARKHHLPYSNTLSATTSSQTSNQVNYSFRHNSRQPKTTEKKHSIRHKQPYNGEEGGPQTPTFLLLIQHLSTTMTCRSFKLSMVKIFPKTVDQAKKVALKETLVRQIFFQEK